MDFLKAILGDDLFGQIEAKINEHNGNEANKENQIKLGNLGSGEYVAKGKYDSELEKLNTLLSGKTTELDTANKLIEGLKKGTKNDEELQKQITGYETEVKKLQNQLAEEKIKYALKFALQSEKAMDVDYLSFKLKEKMAEQGKTLELDENDNIKGWDDVISGLKTQFPTQFETTIQKRIEENILPQPNTRTGTVTKEDFDKMGYQSRLKLKQEQPEVYAQMTGKVTE